MIFSHAQRAPASGPWHLLFPLPGTLYRRYPWLTPSPLQSLLKFPLTSEPSSHPLVQTYTSLHPPSPRSLFSFLFNIRHHLKFYVFINLPYWEFVVPPLYTTRFLNKQSRLWDSWTWNDTHPLLASEWELCHQSRSTWVTKPLSFTLIELIKPEGGSSCWQEATVYPSNHDILPDPTLPIPEVFLIHSGGGGRLHLSPPQGGGLQLFIQQIFINYCLRTRELRAKNTEESDIAFAQVKLTVPRAERKWFSLHPDSTYRAMVGTTDVTLLPAICR